MSSSKTSVWPVVLGVLSIIAGFRAISVFGIVQAEFLVGLARQLIQGDFGGAMGKFEAWDIVCLSSFGCGGILGVLAGVMLLLRRRAALVLHWLYAAGVAGGAGVLIVFVLLPDKGSTEAKLLFRVLTRLAVGLAYPLLVMVWFSRPAVWRHGWTWRTRAGRLASRPVGPIWPTVLGTLGLYWGAVGAVAALLAGIGLLLPLRGHNLPDMLRGWPTHVQAWGSLVLSGLSIAWGVLLRRRRRVGVVLCWVFLVGSAVCTLGTPLPAVLRVLRIWSKFDAWFLLQAAVSLAVRILPLLVWPTFLLIWLSRPKIRAQVRSWGQPRSGVWK